MKNVPLTTTTIQRRNFSCNEASSRSLCNSKWQFVRKHCVCLCDVCSWNCGARVTNLERTDYIVQCVHSFYFIYLFCEMGEKKRNKLFKQTTAGTNFSCRIQAPNGEQFYHSFYRLQRTYAEVKFQLSAACDTVPVSLDVHFRDNLMFLFTACECQKRDRRKSGKNALPTNSAVLLRIFLSLSTQFEVEKWITCALSLSKNRISCFFCSPTESHFFLAKQWGKKSNSTSVWPADATQLELNCWTN